VIPADVAVTGFDDIEEGRSYLLQLTTVHQPLYDLAAGAFDTLLSGIRGGKMPERTVFPTSLIVRRSCGCFSYLAMNKIGQTWKKNHNPAVRKNISKQTLIDIVRQKIEEGIPSGRHSADIHEWAEMFVNALLDNIEKKEDSSFLITLEKIIWKGIELHINIPHWNMERGVGCDRLDCRQL